MTEQWTIMAVLRWTAEHFATKGISSPRLDAELIVAHALGLKRIELYMKTDQPLSDKEREAVRGIVKRRLDGEPVAYITGAREFWTMNFKVTPAVLIPRPETEDVVEAAHSLLVDRKNEPLAILDLCTGSGCIAIALAKELKNAKVVATDISKDALDVARENVAALGFADRITLRDGDLYEALTPDDGPFDLIISNPPYVPTPDFATLQREVLKEPKIALEGGPDGLDFIKRIADGAASRLKDGGYLVMEIHSGHGESIEGVSANGLKFRGVGKDLGGLPRVASWRKMP